MWKQSGKSGNSTSGRFPPPRGRWLQNIAELAEKAGWLAETPMDMKLDACLTQMRARRQPGHDGVVAEALTCGGLAFRAAVRRRARKLWDKVASQAPLHEGDDWPAEWKVGVTVPLWKNRKGLAQIETHERQHPPFCRAQAPGTCRRKPTVAVVGGVPTRVTVRVPPRPWYG